MGGAKTRGKSDGDGAAATATSPAPSARVESADDASTASPGFVDEGPSAAFLEIAKAAAPPHAFNGGVDGRDSGRWHVVDAARVCEMAMRPPNVSDDERLRVLEQELATKSPGPNTSFPGGSLATVKPMSFLGEAWCLLVLLLVPGCLLWVPLGTIAVLVWFRSWAVTGALLGSIALLAVLPAPYSRKHAVHSRTSRLLLRYFSFKLMWRWRLHPKGQYLLIAPPHGAFPFGNLLTMMSMADAAGFWFRGLAASVVLRVPLARHAFAALGVIDASAAVARRHLARGESVGISSGGIAEIYYNNDNDEVILLGKRKGFVKLAFQSGASIVPCYLFGNTAAMRIISDKGGWLQRVSRRLRVSLVFIYGRFGLPIPFRTPIAGATWEPIDVPKKAKPTQHEIDTVHAEFVRRMRLLFETHKHAYGWGHKRLVIR